MAKGKENLFEKQDSSAIMTPKKEGNVDRMKHEIFHDKMAKKLGC